MDRSRLGFLDKLRGRERAIYEEALTLALAVGTVMLEGPYLRLPLRQLRAAS